MNKYSKNFVDYFAVVKSISFIFITVALFLTLLSSCLGKAYTEPHIEFLGGDKFKFPEDSLDVGKSVNFELRCISNGNDLLTRLYIYTDNGEGTVIEDMSIRPPDAAFGYKFSFTKTKASTDSLIFELHDKGGNVGKSLVQIHTKKKKKK